MKDYIFEIENLLEKIVSLLISWSDHMFKPMFMF